MKSSCQLSPLQYRRDLLELASGLLNPLAIRQSGDYGNINYARSLDAWNACETVFALFEIACNTTVIESGADLLLCSGAVSGRLH